MELPPYHKPRWGNLFRYVFSRMGEVLKRAIKIITCVSIIFWALSYTPDGVIENSIIYKIGTAIEPVTMWFGLRWQTFMAWLASGFGKESCLGVLSALFNSEGIWNAIANQKSLVVDTAAVVQFAPHGGHWCVCQRPPGGAQRPPSLRYFDRLNNNNVMLRCPLHNSVG